MTNYTDGNYETNKGYKVKLEKPTQQDLDDFMVLIEGIDKFANYESLFSKELYALMDDLYAGTKTSTEIAQIVQNKYKLYFKENQ